MERVENFPISPELVSEIVAINSSNWTKEESTDNYVIVNFSMVRMQVAWIIPKLMYARGMADKLGAKVVVFTWRPNKELTDLINSFGFEHIVIDEAIKNDKKALLKAFNKTVGFMLTDGSGEGFKNLKIDGLTIGKSLFEDTLRTSSLSTIKSARNKVVMKKMMHLLSFYYMLSDFCKGKNIKAALIDDIAYHEGMVIKLMDSLGCKTIMQMNGIEKRKIIMSPADRPETFSSFLRRFIEPRVTKVNENEAIAWTDNFLQERFKGLNGRAIDRGAFANKKVLNREEMISELGLEPDKKNIVIMAHTFTDAVFNYGDYYFRDYYDWMEKTLQIAATVDSVNWILKPHPTRHSYNEDTDSIEDMFARIATGKKNMFLLADDISGESIINIADAQITIGGNSGGEYSCFGIPTVIVGKPYYAGFGYTYEPETYEKYKECLKDIKNMPKLSEEQVRLAKKVFYVRNSKMINEHFYKFEDEFAKLVNGKYFEMINKMALQYFSNNEGTLRYNDDILKSIIEYFKNHDVKQCDYYKTGFEDA